MKTLLYLASFAAIGSFCVWLFYGLTPKQQLDRILSYLSDTGSVISTHISDTTSSANKLKNRLGEEFDNAVDVYNGKDIDYPFKNNQVD